VNTKIGFLAVEDFHSCTLSASEMMDTVYWIDQRQKVRDGPFARVASHVHEYRHSYGGEGARLVEIGRRIEDEAGEAEEVVGNEVSL